MNSDESTRRVRFPPLALKCRAVFCRHVLVSSCGIYIDWPTVTVQCGTISHQETPEVRTEGRGFPTLFLFPRASRENVAPKAAAHCLCRDPCQSHSYKAAPAVHGDWLDNACTPYYFL